MTDFIEPQSLQIRELVELDGVSYALVEDHGRSFRVGAIAPDWQGALAGRLADPALDADGIWLMPAGAKALPLTVMCCGLGAVWPGMGRELYANFPVAADAMDEIASLADWDLLGLMDAMDLDRISQTRWQIPYLFMLEYAQWRQLKSLGINPQVICGHSLGELIALCVSGVLDAKSAWHLLETRAMHMADLEARSGRQGGMLAVPARARDVQAALAAWPELRISNRNTPSQYILSGPRDQLLEARRAFRRKKIPAVMLSMDLAFHNPAMAVLRDISILRLSGLTMRKPDASLLSCVHGRPYPEAPQQICEAIADLDENAVDWVTLIESVLRDFPAAGFLELGPQEILCGLTGELVPDSWRVPCDRKGHEQEVMAEACARLFAAGHLNFAAIQALARKANTSALTRPAWLPGPAQAHEQDRLAEIAAADQEAILGLLAEVTGKDIAELSPGLDLRRDLDLRSVNFPYLMLEAEKRLGRQLMLENLFRIDTVADLIHFLAGKPSPEIASAVGKRPDFALSRPRIQRYLPDCDCEPPALTRASFTLDACQAPAGPVLLWLVADPAMRQPSTFAGEIIAQDKANGQLPAADYLILAGRPQAIAAAPDFSALQEQILAANAAEKQPALVVIQRFICAQEPDLAKVCAWFAEAGELLQAWPAPWRLIAWLAPDVQALNSGFSDMLLAEIAHGAGRRIVWSSLPGQKYFARYCEAGGFYAGLIPEENDEPGHFQALCQFSAYAVPDLATHGADAAWSPLACAGGSPGSPWLPLGSLLAAMAKGIRPIVTGLTVSGLHDLRVLGFMALPQGVTRECRLRAGSFLELPLDGCPTRHCHVNMDLASLAPSGRKNGLWQPLCDAVFRLAPAPVVLGAVNNSFLEAAAIFGDKNRDAFYQTLGLPPVWQRLCGARFVTDANGAVTGLAADLRLDRELPIAIQFQAVDAFWQAACLCLAAQTESISAILASWRFTRAGLVMYREDLLNQNGLMLMLRLVWSDRELRRFNGGILGRDGLAMTVHNFEFDYIRIKAVSA